MKNLKSSRSDSNRPAFALRLSVCVLLATLLGVANAQTRIENKQKDSTHPQKTNSGATFTPQGGGPAVHGSGTAGMIPKWLDSSSIGDSIMSEASGKIGIGTPSPGSKLSVVGMIETTLGGYKFPDGTVQTTAATGGIGSVAHDSTLTGNGTTSSPLGLAIPMSLGGSVNLPNSLFTVGNTGSGFALLGSSTDGAGIGGTSTNNVGVMGMTDGLRHLAPFRAGVVGISTDNTGVYGQSDNGIGVRGVSVGNLEGVVGSSNGGPGVSGLSGSGDGVVGQSITGAAGRFYGNVSVSGTLSKSGGSFKIDHPLDPENKYLYHSFVESPDMMNIYNGNVTTDETGEAVVKMPDYFEALNFEFRYQLTVIGQFAQAIVSRKIKNNEFAIKTSVPGVEVSWQVTGVRRDAWANKNRIQVEVEKDDRERGFYLHPEVFNQPEERGIQWAQHPELMKRMKQRRQESEKMHASHQAKEGNQ